MQAYLSELAGNIFQGYSNGNRIHLNIEAENIIMGVQQASPLGLIVNELLTNSLKYAFPGKRKGEIALKLKADKDIAELVVSGNGIGVQEAIDLQNSDSLGLKLVKLIADKRLGGLIRMENKNGLTFVFTFNIGETK